VGYSQRQRTFRAPERIKRALLKIFAPLNGWCDKQIERLNMKITKEDIYLKALAFGIVAFAAATVFALAGHADMRRDIIYETGDISSSMGIADSFEIKNAERVIPLYMEQYAGGAVFEGTDALVERLGEEGFRSREALMLTADEITKRIDVYAEEKTTFADVLLTVLASVLGAVVPIFLTAVAAACMGSRVKEEVMQFEVVIDTLKDVEGITMPLILESILSFACVTRKAILKAMAEYNISEAGAFKSLEECSDDRELARLCGFFKRTDMLGIGKAFDEVSAELDGMRQERSMHRVIKTEDEALLASLGCVLPGGIVIFGYLLAPFLIRSLEMFGEYSDSLTNL